eukprot:5929551-Amphidinium_carterae.2
MLEYDRQGVPQFHGEASLWREYRERAWDLFHGRAGQDSLQAATPIHLRAGLRASAYEAVRHLRHEELVTMEDKKPNVEGMNPLLDTLEAAIAKERPIQESELFEKVFYARSIHRQSQESIHSYIVRRK